MINSLKRAVGLRRPARKRRARIETRIDPELLRDHRVARRESVGRGLKRKKVSEHTILEQSPGAKASGAD